MATPTRADDETLLHMLDLYDEGLPYHLIGKVVGVSTRTARRQIRAVIGEDLDTDPKARHHWKGEPR